MDGKGALKTSRNVIVGDCPDLSVPPVWAADLDVAAAYAAADIKSRDDLDRWAAEGLFCRFDIEQVLAGNFRFEYPLELSMTIDGHVRLEGGHLAKNGSISAFSKTILGGGEDVLAEDGGCCIEVPEFPSGTTFFLSAKIGKKNKKALPTSEQSVRKSQRQNHPASVTNLPDKCEITPKTPRIVTFLALLFCHSNTFP